MRTKTILGLLIGLLVVSAMPSLGAATPQPPPGGDGPYFHKIWIATSPDGIAWTRRPYGPLADHGSVPAAIVRRDGTLLVYYVLSELGRREQLGCLRSIDGGQTFTRESAVIRGLSPRIAVDFCPVELPDGRVRLYYYRFTGRVDAPGDHEIASAVSEDGVNFTEEGAVFRYPGLVDPDVFWNGRQWIMHVHSLTANGTVVATSLDGESFAYRGRLDPTGIGVTKPVTLSNGTFRMYGFVQPSGTSFVSLVSRDGLAWTREPHAYDLAPEDQEITDPFVVRLEDGTYFMVYKSSPPRANQPPPSGQGPGSGSSSGRPPGSYPGYTPMPPPRGPGSPPRRY